MTLSLSDWRPLQIMNPGFLRHALEPSPTEAFNADHYSVPYPQDYSRAIAPSYTSVDAWAHLEWWESELLAKIGVLDLLREPFLRLREPNSSDTTPVPAGLLYSYALSASSPESQIDEAARYIVASIRQARECYTAAMSLGVTALSRPILYFYGALALAQAAVVAICGTEGPETRHGLEVQMGPSFRSVHEAKDDVKEWPTLIQWQGRGDFAAFYRIARWDKVYGEKPGIAPKTGWPKFHILECLRVLGCAWGALPPAFLARHQSISSAQDGLLLLPFTSHDELYLSKGKQVLERKLVQVPTVIVQYMVLKYFSDLARYHPLKWQHLLEGAEDPEGYVFRAAMDSVAQAFVVSIVKLLPLPGGEGRYQEETWCESRPSISDWYQPPQAHVRGHTIPLPETHRLPPWSRPEAASDEVG